MSENNAKSAVSVFDPESSAIRYEIGGKTMTLRPLTNKRLRTVIAAVEKSINEVSVMDKSAGLSAVMEMILGRAYELLVLLFPADAHPFLTPEFVDDSMTVPMLRAILDDVVKMNKLEELFPALKASSSNATTGA